MLQHHAGFDEECRGARGGIANGCERARITKGAAALREHRRRPEPRDRRQTDDERHARPHDVRVPAGASRANGSRRTRWPVSWKNAFATAGAMGGTPGSPTPVGAAPEGTMYLDHGHVTDAQWPVAIEVPLLHAAPDERDLVPERRRQTVADPAFHLCAHDVGVDGGAAIDGAYDALDLRQSIGAPRHLRHLRHHTVEGLVHGDAARPARRSAWPSPPSGGEVQRARAAVAWRQGAPDLIGRGSSCASSSGRLLGRRYAAAHGRHQDGTPTFVVSAPP